MTIRENRKLHQFQVISSLVGSSSLFILHTVNAMLHGTLFSYNLCRNDDECKTLQDAEGCHTFATLFRNSQCARGKDQLFLLSPS